MIEINLERKSGKRTLHSVREALEFEKYLSNLPDVNNFYCTYFGPRCHAFRWTLKEKTNDQD